MNPAPTNPVRRVVWLEWPLIVVFAALLWLPTADFFCGLDHTEPAGENRLPAPSPHLESFNLSGVQKYLVASEAYFNDHFGFRKRLIRWFQQWKLRLYHDESVRKAVLGQAGWLYGGENQMVDHYLGIAKFTPEQLKVWQMLLEKRRDWLAARGIKYLFVVAPDKESVYPEFLPAWLQNAAPANRQTKLDQFLAYMREHSTVNILDLRPTLLAAKTNAPLYLQNDTHWNVYGSFVACQKLIVTLQQSFPDLPPLRYQDFTWTRTNATGGDLARMLALNMPDHDYYYIQAKPGLPLLRTNETRDFKTFWGPKVFSTVENPSLKRRAVVLFNDSFGGFWRPFLGQSFQRSVYVFEGREFSTSLISSNAPDVVITEMLEGPFYIRDPQELIDHDAM